MQRMSDQNTSGWPFMKMHGLGNDFVVIDTRVSNVKVTPNLVIALADRHLGVGFDQLAVITKGNDLTITFYNADGSQSAACGNATRCIAAHEMTHSHKKVLDITIAGRGILRAEQNKDGTISVNMGQPQLEWQDIPLSHETDTLSLPINGTPVATGMGNPHCTFFVDDIHTTDVINRGAEIEHHPLFPERTNVQFAQIIGRDHIRMRVWERGTGLTLASGSSSCATAVAAVRRGLTSHSVKIELDGGILHIDWRKNGVWMTGPTAHVFNGTLTQSFLKKL
ncbi:MAG TPA: diaminopimelate epimerase [Rhodobacteraceae bacterium]|jgi:diaminopimelate epimerase|nr:diaminopimelate epimerase [Alphaproteobacteria bacterium]MCH9832151.1 diaminopimelate epimerase [Alphaproteobacteria bacterium]HAB38264.1 diaminopimelate epimerase [Paracoccaceae bacterium]